MSAIQTRDYRPTDAQKTRDVLRAAVRITGRKFYTTEQIQSWLSATPPLRDFHRRLDQSLACRVAVDARGLYAFANISRARHVDFVMCHPRRARQGAGQVLLLELMDAAHANGLTTLTTQASLAARPLFERCGFAVDEPRMVMGLACFGMVCHL